MEESTSFRSEKFIYKILNISSPDIGEEKINRITNTSVPEGIWFNTNLSDKLDPVRVFGNLIKDKDTVSIEVKRIYRFNGLGEISHKAVSSSGTIVSKTFMIDHHIVAFVIHPRLSRIIKEIRKAIIKNVRKSFLNGFCGPKGLSLIIVIGKKNIM